MTRDNRIRCIHVITRLILGGAQENTLLTVEGLCRTPGYETLLVTGPAVGPEGSLLDRARRNNVPCLVLPSLKRAISPWHDVVAYRALLDLFRDRRPHIVHTHSSKAGILGRIAASRAGVPVIVHTIHGPPFHPQQDPLSNWLFRSLERLAARCTNRFISVADAMTEQFVAAGIAPREKFITIYSGMEVEPFLGGHDVRARVREDLGLRPDDLVIGKIARLFHLKGHEDVLRAFTEVVRVFPRARLLFVGDGILRRPLSDLAERLNVRDRVVFAGLVPPDRIPDVIKAMDVLIHASLREGLARVLPQAILSGCPVISYDVDGAREVVRPGETGFLVPPGSVSGLREALLEALGNLERARAMARRGRDMFVDRFRHETMVRRITAVYDEELNRSGARDRRT